MPQAPICGSRQNACVTQSVGFRNMANVMADEHGRPRPPQDAEEIATLLGFLEAQRATLEWKCLGLNDDHVRVVLGRQPPRQDRSWAVCGPSQPAGGPELSRSVQVQNARSGRVCGRAGPPARHAECKVRDCNCYRPEQRVALQAVETRAWP